MRGRFMNEQEVENIIKKQMEENHGIVKKEVLTKQGIDYRRINQLVKDGKLARIKNGYYTDRIDDFSEDALVAALFTDAKLCMESALYAYGYINEKPYGWTIAVDKNTSKARFKMDYPKIIPFYTEPEVLGLGATTIEFNESKMEHDDFKSAIQSYIADDEKDISVLMDYARLRKVVKKVQSLIGVWL